MNFQQNLTNSTIQNDIWYATWCCTFNMIKLGQSWMPTGDPWISQSTEDMAEEFIDED